MSKNQPLCFHSPNDGAHAVDPDRTILEQLGTEAPDDRARQEPFAHRGLGVAGRPSIEPFVEVERERILDQADIPQAGARQQVHQFTAREVSGVSPIARDLEGRMMIGALSGGIGDMVVQDQNASRAKQIDLARHEGRGVDHMMQHVTRQGRIERTERIERTVEDRDLKEGRSRAMARTTLLCSLDHLPGEVDSHESKPGLQQSGPHQARPAAGVEHQAARRQGGFVHQPRDRNRVALDRRTLEFRSL